jgi:hypothetical protein
MAVDEGARHQLFKRLEDLLGEREAGTLMAHLPPVGWADVATKKDLERLEAVNNSEHARLEAAFKADHRRLDAQIDARLHRMESRLLRTILITNSTSVLTVGGLAFAAARLI